MGGGGHAVSPWSAQQGQRRILLAGRSWFGRHVDWRRRVLHVEPSEQRGVAAWFTGVIAVVGAHKGYTVKSQPDDVHVCTRKQVARWLRRQEPVLTEEQVAAIHRVARKSTTWQ